MQTLDIDVNGLKTRLAVVTYVDIDCRIDYPAADTLYGEMKALIEIMLSHEEMI